MMWRFRDGVWRAEHLGRRAFIWRTATGLWIERWFYRCGRWHFTFQSTGIRASPLFKVNAAKRLCEEYLRNGFPKDAR